MMAEIKIYLYLLSLASSVTKVLPCPDILFEYNSKCYSQCPRMTYLIEGTQLCSRNCPDFAPYILHGNICVKYCPDGYFHFLFYRKYDCMKKTDNNKKKKSADLLSYGCPPSIQCDSPRRYCYRLQCFKQCPTETKVFGLQCVDECPKNAPYSLNNTCVEKCQQDYKLLEKKCVKVCPLGFNVFNNVCVKNCPLQTFLNNGSCVTKCPNEQPFALTVKNSSSCHKVCPAYTSISGRRCELVCPSNLPFLHNRTCVSSCPSNSRYYMYIKTPYNEVLPCLPFCPEDRLLDGNTCVTKCVKGMFQFQKTCVSICPDDSPLQYLDRPIDRLKCVSVCPLDSKYAFQNKCILSCPEELYIFNSTQCVSQCPPTDPLLSKPYLFCVSECDKSEYQYSNACYAACPHHLKRYGRTCVKDCKETNNTLLYRDYGEDTCVEICPKNLLNSSFTCVSQCPLSSKYITNNTCYSVCPKSAPYHTTRYTYPYIYYSKRRAVPHFECATTCGYRKVINGTFCIDQCPQNTKRYDSTCFYHCPSEVPYTSKYNTCVDECKLYLNTTCVDLCPSEMCILNDTCISIDNDTFTYSRENGDKYCVSKCPEHTYQLGNICFDVCPDSYVHFNYSCKETCPDSHPFHYEFNISKRPHAFGCVEMCSKATYIYNHQCLTRCPSDRPLKNNQTCVSQCPGSIKYVRADICVKNCSASEYETPEHQCVAKCPASYGFAYGQKCIKECPSNHSFYTDNGGIRKCTAACPSNLITYAKKCVHMCPNVIINGHCLNQKSCPEDYPIQKNSSRGKECSNSCSNDEKLDQNKCVIKCLGKRKFVFENSCVSECPPSHRYYEDKFSDNKCVAVCDEYRIALGRKCIRSLDCTFKNGMLILDNKFCVHRCPPNSMESFYDNTCRTIPGYVLPLFITGLIIFILISIACGIFCLGNCSLITISTKSKMLIDTEDGEETCALQRYTEDFHNEQIRCRVNPEEIEQSNVNEDNKELVVIAMNDYTEEICTADNVVDR